jgi:hypothetical protein
MLRASFKFQVSTFKQLEMKFPASRLGKRRVKKAKEVEEETKIFNLSSS